MFKVRNFTYNGLGVNFEGGLAKYTAKFIKWTNDPGVGEFKCSDGKVRLMPSCVLVGPRESLPKKTWKSAEEQGVSVLFGTPCAS